MPNSKQKSKKIAPNSTNSEEESEHELFHYANDRIRLMKEVLKLIKPKKMKAIAPETMKNLDIDEINSMLLEELLGISNKRLRHILNGDNIDTVSTSSDSEPEQKPIDVISLDDISDTDDEFGLGNVNAKIDSKGSKHKHKRKFKEVKKEKTKESHVSETDNNKLMNVLEILELQARARAIRSQLALENINKQAGKVETIVADDDDDDDDMAVIISSPRREEIIIMSSESEDDISQATSNKDKDSSSSGNKANETSKPQNGNSDSGGVIIDSNTNESDKLQDKNSDSAGGIISSSPSRNNSPEKSRDGNSDFGGGKDGANTGNPKDKIEENVVQQAAKVDIEEKDANYRSDSDNDVINLDSEDIENV